MRRFVSILFLSVLTIINLSAQSKIVKDFKPVCDSLSILLKERTSVSGELKLKAVTKRGTTLDFYFTESLGDFPWYKGDDKWFETTLKRLYPEKYSKYKLGEVYSRLVPLDKLITPSLTFDGSHVCSEMTDDSYATHARLVKEIGTQDFSKGLSGRHIALWQSHGRYYEQQRDRWEWQRPCLFQTCEDMFTQGFVLPYLVPMLENAGAYVMLPRERDTQRHEIIADNDTTCGARGTAHYLETGSWESGQVGFADTKPIYEDLDNPFKGGTYRIADIGGEDASARWTPVIPERGKYAVYISYKSLPNSTTAAHYTVYHMGGTSEFVVNQKMGGGTWIYLGTFEFEPGERGYVMLDNKVCEGYKVAPGCVVTADAVKIGGGMGNIARGLPADEADSLAQPLPRTLSGMPRYAEGARYWLQWAGADSTVIHQNEGKSDYRDDFMCRGDWVDWISLGSEMNPSRKDSGLSIPVDLSFGFHSDAGVSPDDSLIGTLAIYTYKSEGKTRLPGGENRMTSRMYADMVQSQVIHDLRSEVDSLWSRRNIWDRAYRESRTPSCPAMLLELLSHQNFADMKYGLDPSFRFTVCRAVYKGMLKYLSNRFGTGYVVQPLPVNSIGVRFSGSTKATVSWKPTEDKFEPTATPTGYILYTRCGDGAFDKGVIVEDIKEKNGLYHTEVDLVPGQVMSYKVAAFNDGGVSFPSETVSIGLPVLGGNEKPVVVVNNFDRVGPPAYFDTPSYAGFDNGLDSGVADGKDITFVGETYEFRRDRKWISNDRPGFGASHYDKAGEIIAGNTFDYPSIHGKVLLDAGYPFYSCSNERFIADSLFCSIAWAADIICGKQVTSPDGKFQVFPADMQRRIKSFASEGGHLLVSGAYIGTDLWDEVYPAEVDSLSKAEAQEFAKSVLGYELVTGQASNAGVVSCPDGKEMNYWHAPNPASYCVESPDGIKPSSADGTAIYWYPGNMIPAGVAYDGTRYKCISLGFPIEVMKAQEDIHKIITDALDYFER